MEKAQAQLQGERQRLQEDLEEVQERLTAESAHQKGATDQVEAMARDLEYYRSELGSAQQNLDKAHSDQSKVCTLTYPSTSGGALTAARSAFVIGQDTVWCQVALLSTSCILWQCCIWDAVNHLETCIVHEAFVHCCKEQSTFGECCL